LCSSSELVCSFVLKSEFQIEASKDGYAFLYAPGSRKYKKFEFRKKFVGRFDSRNKERYSIKNVLGLKYSHIDSSYGIDDMWFSEFYAVAIPYWIVVLLSGGSIVYFYSRSKNEKTIAEDSKNIEDRTENKNT
jgi:hypothetical protein